MSFQILWLWNPYKESRHVSKREGRKLQDQVLSGLSHHSISSLSASHSIMVTRDCKWGQLETLKLAMKSMENSELQKGTKLGPFQPREKARGGDPNLVNRYRRVDQVRKSSRVGKRSKIENTQTHTHTQQCLHSECSIQKHLHTYYRKIHFYCWIRGKRRSQLGGLAFLYFPNLLLPPKNDSHSQACNTNKCSPQATRHDGRGICKERPLPGAGAN